MIKEGDNAINFNMPIDDENFVTLESFPDNNIVLYFYPKDDTPGCTREAIDFTAHINAFEECKTTIIGVSADSTAKHKKFIEKHNLEVILASDEDKKVCKDYGVWIEKSMYGKKFMGIERATILIDKNRKITKIWRKVNVTGHVEEVLEAAQKI
ncbi:MAG: peroxiredoxin [Rhodobiaceae bacterium]|nr:peroxiredoxin [Rhodobiaceae bacterium]|tara:strand:+ start:4652 stop:5113 length:462 start_codon:yes stop_codon:yes gene_type:complete